MKLESQTATKINPDEQEQVFDSSSTDFKDFILLLKQRLQEVNDRTNSEMYFAEIIGYKTYMNSLGILGLVTPLASPALLFTKCHNKWLEFDRESLRYLFTSAWKEKQADVTEIAYVETILQVEVMEKIKFLFSTVEEEIIEGEIEDRFAKSLTELIQQYEDAAINEIHHVILKEKIPPELSEVTLRVLGDIDHKQTYNYRRWLLEKALIGCSSPIVRDGANLGLSYMDDPHAIPLLKEAIQNETIPLLRKVMEKTLAQLEDTKKCHSSCTEQNTINGSIPN